MFCMMLSSTFVVLAVSPSCRHGQPAHCTKIDFCDDCGNCPLAPCYCSACDPGYELHSSGCGTVPELCVLATEASPPSHSGVDVSIVPHDLAARIGNVTNSDTTNVTYLDVDLSQYYQVRFWDYVYHAPTNFGGLTFDQVAGNVSLACQPPGWSPAKEVFRVDGRDVGECVGGGNILTASYGANSTVQLTISKP